MSDEDMDTFQVSPQEQTERRGAAVSKKFLHVTIVDHNPAVEGTDDVSFLDVRIPAGMVEAGLRMIPQGKLGDIDPTLIVQMVEMGAEGEIVKLENEKKSINIRME